MLENTKIGSWVASIDAFPKIDTAYLKRTTSGGLASIFTFMLMGLLMFSEFWSYWFPPQVQRFVVDRTLGNGVTMTFDVSIATSCDKLLVILGDDTSETVSTIDDSMTLTEENFAPYLDRSLRKGTVFGCRISGSKTIPKLKGRLVFMPLVQAMGDFGEMIAEMDDTLNFSHVIHRFDFGPSYPGMKNPLEASRQTTLNAHERFIYHLAVIPAFFSRGSWDGKGHLNAFVTNQYALSGMKAMSGERDGEKTGLHFRFDFEPLALIISRDGMPFSHFFVHLIGILGGIYTSTSVLHHFFNWLIAMAQSLFKWQSAIRKKSFDTEWIPVRQRTSITKTAPLPESDSLLEPIQEA